MTRIRSFLHGLDGWRRVLDKWFPTVVRYIGVIGLGYGFFVDKGANPALIPAATGMILFKTVYGDGDKK